MTLKRKEIVDELIRRLNSSFPLVPVSRNVVGFLMDAVLKSTPRIVITEEIEKCKIPAPGVYEKELTVWVDYFATSIDVNVDLYEVMLAFYEAIELDLRFKQNGNGEDLVMSFFMIENTISYYDDPNNLYNIQMIYNFVYKENSPGVNTNSRRYLRRPS